MQLNAFEPIIAHSLFASLHHLRAGCLTLSERCVDGITANRDRLRQMVEHSIGLITALNPYIGYTNATEIAPGALGLPAHGKTVNAVKALPKEGDKIGRNEPCWCGSGRKFKQCHGRP